MSNTSLLGSFGGQGDSSLMFRNVLINGCFRVWQRGASFTPTSLATIYTTDRWACYRPAFATGLLASRQSASGLAGFPNALRVERSSGNAGTSNIIANQSIESINMVHLIGQTVTLSFYARVGSGFSAASSILTSSFISGTGTDESLANTGYTGQAVVDQSNTVTTSWQRFTHTYTVPSNANELTVHFRYTPTGTSAGNDWFELTGVQLEAGPTATPFERRPIGQEIQLCQRYYEKSYDLGVAPGTSTTAGIVFLSTTSTQSNGIFVTTWPFKVQKRINPNKRCWTSTGTLGQVSYKTGATEGTTSASAAGEGAQVNVGFFGTLTANTFYAFSYHWDAECEL